MKTKGLFIGALVYLSLFCSCTSDYGTVDVYLVRSPNVEENPLDTSLVSHVRIRVTGGGMEPMEEVFAFKSGGSSTLGQIPAGDGRIITVEGLAGQNDEYAISRGRSLPVRIEKGHQKIELFVARVGRFSYTPGHGLKQARFAHTAMLSYQGKLLLIGGATAGSWENPKGLLSSIEIYDPTSGKTEHYACGRSSNDMCLEQARAQAAGVTIEDGILLLGGMGRDDLLSSVEFIDIEQMSIEQLSFTSAKRSDAAVIALSDKYLVAGGRDSEGNAIDVVEIISPEGTIKRANLEEPRWAMAAARSGANGFLFGGFDENGDISNDFLLFDSSKDEFVIHETETQARAWASAVSLQDGRVLVLGGLDTDGEASQSIDLFDPKRNMLCPLGELRYGRWLTSAVRLTDGRVLVMGGLTGLDPGEPTAGVEILDPRFVELRENCGQTSGMLSTSPAQNMKIRRFASSAIVLHNGAVAVAGGLDQDNNPVKQIEVFIPDD
ncbi:MAG: hypothetical protein GY847_37390 [Proteobacteria bacterium]|nr:hypothetical protein [Pseudomonadota bacterium]